MRGRVQVAERGSDSPAWRVGRSTLDTKANQLLGNLNLTPSALSASLVAGGQRTTRAKGEEVKKIDWATISVEEVREIIKQEKKRIERKTLRDIRSEWKARRERQENQEA